MRGNWSWGRIRVGGVHEAAALDAGALFAISEKDGVVPAGRRRADRWLDGMVRTANSRRRIQTRWRSLERAVRTPADDSPAGAKAVRRDDQLCFRQRWRGLQAE